MDKQLVYDMVRDHLMNQYEKSMSISSVGSSCAYRGEKGLMCAIGCLIPDELYSPDIEGTSTHDLPVSVLDAIGVDDDTDVLFLSGLQDIHDSSIVPSWPSALYDFAIRNGLRP